MKWVDGGVTAPKGYRAAGVAAGIKKDANAKDCALVVSDEPAMVAGMFTKNVMKSPPVYLNQKVCEGGRARAVFINSGGANAATGKRGHEDAATTAAAVGEKLGIERGEVCICSTGVIGVLLPMDRIQAGVEQCFKTLSPKGSADAAEAMMTTDTARKEFALEVALSGGPITLGAIAKGSGMICPNMATMICIVTTDAEIGSDFLREALSSAVDASFNQIGVDNDMSTSDTVLVFANGACGLSAIESNTEDARSFSEALTALCRETAKALVKDGEGATKFVEIAVSGASTDDDAKRIARAIGNSQLCKTAFFGEDPNWGRFACAAGYAGVAFDPDELSIRLDEVVLTERGLVAEYLEEDAAAIMKKPEFQISVSVGTGPGSAVFWTSDLSHDYVSINADYRS